MRARLSALLHRFVTSRKTVGTKVGTGYVGEFETWHEAKAGMTGYSDPAIAKQVAAGAAEVVAGRKAYERDSVTFEKRQYAFPIATALLWAARSRSELNVIDFGGGLGTSYYQNRPFLQSVARLNWVIVEQQTFVEQGNLLFRDGQVSFHADLGKALAVSDPHIVLLSSSLQYVERPYDILEIISRAKAEIIVVDRTLFSDSSHDVVTRQHVSADIFSAVIPTWIFSESKFLDYMQLNYALVSKFPASCSTADNDREDRNLEESGYLFVLRGSEYDSALQLSVSSESFQ